MSNLGDASVVLIHRAFSRETTTALVTMAMLELATTTPTSVSCPTIVHCPSLQTVERFLSLLRSKPLAVMVVSGTLRLSFRFRCQCR